MSETAIPVDNLKTRDMINNEIVLLQMTKDTLDSYRLITF
jgi:hypothetical protein